MSEFDIKAIFQRMYIACDVRNDNQLSKFFAVKPSTIQGWKNAKHPPLKACFEIYQRTGYSVEWLISGEHPAFTTSMVSSVDLKDQKVVKVGEEEFAKAYARSVMYSIALGYSDENESTLERNFIRLGKILYRELNGENLLGIAKNTKVDSELNQITNIKQ